MKLGVYLNAQHPEATIQPTRSPAWSSRYG